MYKSWAGNYFTAKGYADSGLNVIPIRCDGSKKPCIYWKQYIDTPYPWFQCRHWFTSLGRANGIALVCGTTSRNLELLDFDRPDAFPRWSALVDADLLARLPIVQTPKDGRHVWYRCPVIEGNQHLALYPVTNGDKVEGKPLIETRGQGGYALAPGTPSWAHPLNKPYTLLNGDLCKVPTITPEQRQALFEAARSLNEYTPPSKPTPKPTSTPESNRVAIVTMPTGTPRGDRPGDDFNARASWDEVLEPHGWTCLKQRGDVGYWRKPDSHGTEHHATTNHGDTGLFFVFTTAVAPTFEAQRGYSKFAVYTALNHAGNYHDAALALGKAGYGMDAQIALQIEELYGFRI